jgi:hypothetical protein
VHTVAIYWTALCCFIYFFVYCLKGTRWVDVLAFKQENSIYKEQFEAAIRESTILKKAFAIQHERQKEQDERSQELQQLKQLVVQYQEQVRSLEVHHLRCSTILFVDHFSFRRQSSLCFSCVLSPFFQVNNYALSMHLRQAQQGSSIPGHFHRDIFWIRGNLNWVSIASG